MITNDEGGYPNGIGHSGSETSEEASKRVTGRRSQQVHTLVANSKHRGLTVNEVQQALRIGHGSASGALTRLHRAGYIVRLTQKRNGQQVYMAEAFSAGREQSPYRPNVAYREGYKQPMALESQLSPEQHEQVYQFLTSGGVNGKNATAYEAECFLKWFPEVVDLLRG